MSRQQEIKATKQFITDPETKPFRMIYYAPSFSGKSKHLNDVVLPAIGSKFKPNIFVFSPTARHDTAYKGSKIKEENFIDSYDEAKLQQIINEQEENIERHGKKKAPPVLIILDDVVADLPEKRRSLLSKLFTRGRHLKISIIITSQQVNLIPKAARLNATHNIIFGQKLNSTEHKDLADMLPVSKKIVDMIVHDIRQSDPYSYLFVDLTEAKPDNMFFKNTTDRYVLEDVAP